MPLVYEEMKNSSFDAEYRYFSYYFYIAKVFRFGIKAECFPDNEPFGC